jgi:hypothetical protein
MNFSCDICNYETCYRENYLRHTKTKKHLENKEGKQTYDCTNCLKKFSTQYTCKRHENTCVKNNETNEIIEGLDTTTKLLLENILLKEKLKFKETEKELESKLNKEKIENQLLKEFQKEKTKLIKQNNKQLLKSKDEQIDLVQNKSLESAKHAYSEGRMNALTFLSLSYNKTPKMPSLPRESDYVVADVKSDKEIKYWIQQRPDFADEFIAERLLHIYERKDFANYITNIIVKAYKKDDPAEQTFWASDVSRLIYIIRSTLNQKDEWIYDKKGGIIKESIIDPLLDEVHNIIIKYYKHMHDRYLHSVIKEESDYYMSKLPILRIAENLIKDFKNRQYVKNQIIKTLAPKFYLDRDIEKNKNKIIKDKSPVKEIEYVPPKIENNTIFDKIKRKKLEESKKIEESSEDTEEFLNDPRVKFKMERENKQKISDFDFFKQTKKRK